MRRRAMRIGILCCLGLLVLLGASVKRVLLAGEDAPEVVTAKIVPGKLPTFNATAYIAGHGGHIAIIDMRTMKSPVNAETDRIVLTEAGSEIVGDKMCGMSFEDIRRSGGSHGHVIVREGGRKVLVAGTLSGNVYKIDLATRRKVGPFKVGKKFCGAIAGPDGLIYFEDMEDGNIYVWDYKTLKLAEKMPVGRSICGIQWSRNGQKAYITDMPLGTIYVYDWKTKKKIREITSPEMTYIHQMRRSPDGKYLWVAAANEFDPGLRPGTHHSQLIVIDTTTDRIVKRIILPDTMRSHDLAFSPDGKYVFLTSRTYGNDSLLSVMDASSNDILGSVSVCGSCHRANGIKITIDNGSPLLCGIEIDWAHQAQGTR